MKQFNDLNGVLLLDKPSGITSNRALQVVKNLFNAKGIKVGHTGSLDPLATGMLPICFGEAAKFSSFLLNSDKRYLVTMQLGLKTDTGDLDGAVIATDDSIKNKYLEKSAVNQVLEQFIGKISQIPPIYSAIKQNGVRLYKLARSIKQQSAGIENGQIDPKMNITLLPRIVTIHEIKLLNICNTKKQISLEVCCSKGTYIRSLVTDIAAKLNCLATVATLRRTMVGSFISENMVTILELENLVKDYIYNQDLSNKDNVKILEKKLLLLLLPVKICLTGLPVLAIKPHDSLLLQHGKRICLDNKLQFTANSLICLINSSNDQLLGVGKVIEDNILVAHRLVRIK